jgi:hypothetical protein
MLKKHLGNSRGVFSKTAGPLKSIIKPAIEQSIDYYPFGKSFENNKVSKKRYLYNR